MASCLVWLVKMIWEWNFKIFWTFLVIGHKKFTALFLEWGTCTKVTVLWKLMSFHIFFSLELWNAKVTYGFGFWGLGHRASLGWAACGVCGTAAPLLGGAPPWVRSAVLALTPNFYLVVPRSFVGGLVHDARSFDGIVLKKMRASLGLHSVLFNKQI